ncbi:MAG: FKBP-type peptidyl-prolyl cis-trans isomerase [Rikenellaceae bacterium]
MAKRPNKEWVIANQKFLSEKAALPDVEQLGGGVLYRVLTRGEGAIHPTSQSVVSVHYEGQLISGKVFDSTLKNSYPETFRLREVIEGWQVALAAMRVGDRWEVYIPSEVGYGDRTIDNIPGGSTLIFTIDLVAIS